MNTNALPLLNDEPAGTDPDVKVEFNHQLYSKLLRDITISNRPGICIGFFARWGQGKSTVINLLKNHKKEKARVVIFNAYQARGDSVRRQMLLAILRQISPDKAHEFERFSQIVTPLEFATAEEKDRYSGGKLIKLLMLEKKIDPVLIGAAVLATVSLAAFAVRGLRVILGKDLFAESGDLVASLSTALVGSVAFIWRRVSARKDRILAYTQPVSDSQRLKYPEQFASVFAEAVGQYCDKNQERLIVVVDDLDRCDPGTVVEALASVRQFCHVERDSKLNCQFLIPCDEGQMVSALEADGYALTACHTHYHNYSEAEMLKKFFDIVVRMDEIVPESLADFAAAQASVISVDQALARDVVDACGIREPRKVKSLINAIRIAQETVVRNQKAGILPSSEQLDRLEHTLAALVCLQEFAPKTFAEIRDNPDILGQWGENLTEKNEPIVRRILAGLGPVSSTTAGVLITKQNEPSLLGSPVAHKLPAAVRADRGDEIVAILNEVDDQERERLLGWLARKLRDANSSVRVRQFLVYALDYAAKAGWKSPSLLRFMEVLRKQGTYLQEALRLDSRFFTWTEYCATLPTDARVFYDDLILKNFLGAPDMHPNEEKYLLRFASTLSTANKKAFRLALEATLYPNNVANVDRLRALAANLPENEATTIGFAPSLGERLFTSLTSNNNSIGPDGHEACRQVGLRFIGGNNDILDRIFATLLVKVEVLKRPTELTNENIKTLGVYFDLIHGLLRATEQIKAFPEFFRTHLWPWIEQQRNAEPRLRLIRTIQPGWGMLPENELIRLSQTTPSELWGNESFTSKIASFIDEPIRGDDAWLKGRDRLRTLVFTQFCAFAKDQPSLLQSLKVFSIEVAKSKWDAKALAESLLSEKVRRLNPNVGGRPANINDWIQTLQPICDPKLPEVRQVMLESLKLQVPLVEFIGCALKWLWIDGIPPECAIPLGNALMRDANNILTEDIKKQLYSRTGFVEVTQVILAQIKSKDAAWMHNQSVLMNILTDSTAAETQSSAQFQSAIAPLLTANNPSYLDTGLNLLAKHERISSETKRFLSMAAKGQSEQIVKRATEIGDRPDL